jgi:hypothetical protein
MRPHTLRILWLCLLGTMAGCGDNILLNTDYFIRDAAGRSFGQGTGGGGGSYDSAAPPQWPVTLSVAVHAAEHTAGPTPIIPIQRMTLTSPNGSACTSAVEPSCSLTCALELKMTGPGPCVVEMKAETDEEGTLTQCFTYTLTDTQQFDAASAQATKLCGDE